MSEQEQTKNWSEHAAKSVDLKLLVTLEKNY